MSRIVDKYLAKLTCIDELFYFDRSTVNCLCDCWRIYLHATLYATKISLYSIINQYINL